MFWIKIGVNRKTLFTIEGQNITSGDNPWADYKVTVTKERDKSKHQVHVRGHLRALGLLRLCWNVLHEVMNIEPRIDEYNEEGKTKWSGRAPSIRIK